MSTYSNIHNCITGYPDAVSLAVTNLENDLVLKGRYFGLTKVIELASGAKEQTIAVIGPTKLLVGFLNFAASGNTLVTAYIFPEITDNGDPIFVMNRNATSSVTPDTKLFIGPTFTSLGIDVGQWLVPGGQGQFSTGGLNGNILPFVLPAGQTFALEFENLDSTASNFFNWQFNFFESRQNPLINS